MRRGGPAWRACIALCSRSRHLHTVMNSGSAAAGAHTSLGTAAKSQSGRRERQAEDCEHQDGDELAHNAFIEASRRCLGKSFLRQFLGSADLERCGLATQEDTEA